MADITAAAVKALREKTDLPMMECKKALTEAEGDEARAIEILREQFKKVQLKRADNVTEEGRVFLSIRDDGSEAAMVEIQCESAPVASGEVLGQFGQAMVDTLLNGPGASTPDELLAQTPQGGSSTFQQQFEEIVNKIREKIVINRVIRVKGPVGGYVHHDHKTGVLFRASGEVSNPEVLRDVAMHIAALRPVCTHTSEVEPDVVKKERDRLVAEAKSTGKPDNIIEKMVDGRMKSFYVEHGVLVLQPFAKDDSKTVEKALAEVGAEAVGFDRWRVGGE